MVVNVRNKETDIVADIKMTLETLRASDDLLPVFSEVKTVDDVESFIRIDDPLKASHKTDAGIVVGDTDQDVGSDDTESAVRKMVLSVVVRFYQSRKPGGDERDAVTRKERYVQLVRDALLQDASRGGACNLVVFNGKVINCTDVDGAARLITRSANQMFYAVSIPVSCVYSVFSGYQESVRRSSVLFSTSGGLTVKAS
jgi:hypothetical protein